MEEKQKKIVSAELLIGIIVSPLIFAWFTLRDGYSQEARVSAFGWLAVNLLLLLGLNAWPSSADVDDDNHYEKGFITKTSEVNPQKNQLLTSDDLKSAGAGITRINANNVSQVKGYMIIELVDSKEILGAGRIWDFAERSTRIFKEISQNFPYVLEDNTMINIVSEINQIDDSGNENIKKIFSMKWKTNELKAINWDNFNLADLIGIAEGHKYFNSIGKEVFMGYCDHSSDYQQAQSLCKNLK